jgi:serine/threonine protein kinase
MKPENILVNQQALPTIIDTDSFQVPNYNTNQVYHCLVGSEGFTPPELLGKDLSQVNQNPSHDNFRLAVIIYHILFGEHPFKGHWTREEDPPEIDELIRQGFWPYAHNSLMQPGKITIRLDIVHPQVQECFRQCFNQGHHHPLQRPSATDWVKALQVAIADLVRCEQYSSHWYTQTYGRCYWCERATNVGRDVFANLANPYQKLNNLLKRGQWKEADLETKYLMLKISEQLDKGWLDESAIQRFPSEALDNINSLWQDYSQGRFGFIVQKRIYLETGNVLGTYHRESYCHFGEVVGWLKDGIWKNYRGLDFSISAPLGHLPYCSAGFDICLVSYLALKL